MWETLSSPTGLQQNTQKHGARGEHVGAFGHRNRIKHMGSTLKDRSSISRVYDSVSSIITPVLPSWRAMNHSSPPLTEPTVIDGVLYGTDRRRVARCECARRDGGACGLRRRHHPRHRQSDDTLQTAAMAKIRVLKAARATTWLVSYRPMRENR